MDWLEELAEKIKKKLNQADLRKSLIFYLAAAMFAMWVLYLFTMNICDGWIWVLKQRYSELEVVKDHLHVNFLTKGMLIEEDMRITKMIRLVYNYCIYVYMFLAFAAGLFLFYRTRLYPALVSSKEALDYLLIGDYGHEFSYQSEDELGALCSEIEELRLKLIEEKKRQWENREDLRKINAAFAHDMRTPITVMKGYTEFLLKYIPQGKISREQLLEKLELLLRQQDRLYEFSRTMTNIRNLEMREPESKRCCPGEIEEQMEEAAKALAVQWEKELIFRTKTDEENPWHGKKKEGELLLDSGLVLEAVENLVSNALRYAKKQVRVELVYAKHRMTVYVRDDGPGFSPLALREASKAYYSEEKGEHFGMGLFICRTICEKHGGGLTLINSVEGGAIAAAAFLIS